jgi:preprotein translocase subunit SecF
MTPTFRFMAFRNIAFGVSLALMLISVISLAVRGLNFGLDFTGGTLVEIGFDRVVDPEDIRAVLASKGYPEAVVQQFGTDREILVRVPPRKESDQSKLGDEVFASVSSSFQGATLRQSSFVGPAVGEELAEDGGLAMLAALVMILVYIMFRFTKQFAYGAVIALFHDVLITLGCFSLFGWIFDLPTLAAVLAIIGYSINDTIVIADRIRENIRGMRKMEIVDIIDLSTNQTLGRSLMTSGTTLFVVIALLLFGGEMIRDFAIALTIGITVGTYSSIYIAAAIVLVFKFKREDLLPPPKGKEAEATDEYVP